MRSIPPYCKPPISHSPTLISSKACEGWPGKAGKAASYMVFRILFTFHSNIRKSLKHKILCMQGDSTCDTLVLGKVNAFLCNKRLQ